MMKVVCIDSKPRIYSASDPANLLKEGDVYVVAKTDTATCKRTGIVITGYVLVGFNPLFVFAENRFIPLSDKDETTLVNEEFEEKYCVPVNS